jgi:hypothetical protein
MRQWFTTRGSATLKLSGIPDYYVRHYRVYEPIPGVPASRHVYRPFEFSKHEVSLSLREKISKETEVDLTMAFADYTYNQFYPEYDSHDYFCDLELDQDIGRRSTLVVAYRYTVSNTKGRNSSNILEADASFRQSRYTIGWRQRLPLLGSQRQRVAARLWYYDRKYTTDHTMFRDPLHSGREDYVWDLNLTYTLNLRDSLDLLVSWHSAKREIEAPGERRRIDVAEERDFKQNRYGIGLSYRF